MEAEWVAAERRELADALADLSPEQWETPSSCDGWTITHVLAHVTMPFRLTTAGFVREMVRARGRFDRMADTVARRDAARYGPAELHRSLAANAAHPWRPPGGGDIGALTHDTVHGLDMTRPLGIDRPIPEGRLVAVLDSVTSRRGARAFGVDVTGLGLIASDVEWSTGDGEPVVGRAVDLIALLTGRAVPTERFGGDGVAALGGVHR